MDSAIEDTSSTKKFKPQIQTLWYGLSKTAPPQLNGIYTCSSVKPKTESVGKCTCTCMYCTIQ